MTKKALIWLLAFVLVLGLAAVLTTCTPAEEEAAAEDKFVPPESTIEEILKRGVMKVGLGIFVPWSFKDKDGNLVGYEVDISKLIAEEMGVEVEFVPTQWSGIIPALLTGKFDFIIGGMGITTERALKVNFTNPVNYSGMDMVANKNMIPGETTLEAFNNENIIIAVRMGATPVAAAKKHTPKAQLHQFEDDSLVIQDVLNGNAHAAMSTTPKPTTWVTEYPDILYRPLGGELFTREPSCIAVRKGDHDSLAFLNAWIEDHRPWIDERYQYWFRNREWAYLLGE